MKTGETYGIVWMKDVGSRRIVDNYDAMEIATESTQVFDVIAAVEDARFAKQARTENAPLV